MDIFWKPVVGYEGLYEVSNSGQVRSLPRAGRRQALVLKPTMDHKGYLRYGLRKDGVTRTHSAHRLVAYAFLGPAPDAYSLINHKDLCKANNALANLEWCSPAENTRHAVKNGRPSLSNAVLDAAAVLEIRARYVPRTSSSAELATAFGVTQRTIVRVANGDFWKHITKQRNPSRARKATASE